MSDSGTQGQQAGFVPNRSYVYPSGRPYADWLVSPHGMVMDANDVLWIVDDGKRARIQEIPPGAAKVVGIDIKTGKIVASVPIEKDAMSNQSHLNDLRVDMTHGTKGTTYIANSGFGKRYSLVVVDIASGKSREVLLNQPCTSPEPGFMAFLEGQPKVFKAEHPTFPVGGADGISLNPDGKRLYWTPLSGRRLYSISTAVLSDYQLSETEIEKAVVDEGERPACDELAEDDASNANSPCHFWRWSSRSLSHTRLFRHPGTYRTIPSLSTVCTRTPQEDDATDFAPICPAVKRLGLQYSYCATFVPLSKPFRSRFTPKKSPSRQARFPSHRDELLGCGRYELLLYE